MKLGGTAGAAAKVQCTQIAADLPIVSGKQVEPSISLHSPRSSFSSLTPGSGVECVQLRDKGPSFCRYACHQDQSQPE